MPLTDYNKTKKLEVTSQNDSGATVNKAQPVILEGPGTKLDDLESGSSELDWESNSNVTIDTNSEINGSNSLKLTSSSGFTSVSRDFINKFNEDGDKFEVAIKIDNQSSFTGDSVYFELKDNSGNAIVRIIFNDAGNIEEFFSGTNLLSSWSANTIYNITATFDFTNNQVDIDINGTTTSNINFSTNEITSLEFNNDTDNSGVTRNLFWDDYSFKREAAESDTGTGDIVVDFANIAGPEDIAVYDQNGNLLDYEIEDLDTTAETAVLWCYNSWTRDDSVQAQIAYGDNSANEDRSVDGTGSNPYDNLPTNEHTHHLVKTSLDLLDSTSNNNNITSNNEATLGVTGQFSNAVSGDGTYDILSDGVPMPDITSGNWVMSAWIKADNPTGSSPQRIFVWWGGNTTFASIQLNSSGNGELEAGIRDSQSGNFKQLSSGFSPSADTWYHYAFEVDVDNGEIRHWIDGNLENTQTNTELSNNWNFTGDSSTLTVLSQDGNNNNFAGDVDEIRGYSGGKGTDYWSAEFDASPKGGQVFFSQQAAETTVTTETKTFSTDISVEDRDVTEQLSTDIIVENQNVPETFTQDVNVQATDQEQNFDTSVTVQDENVEKTFTQDATVLDRDAEKTLSTDVSLQLQDQTATFDQDLIISVGNIKTFEQTVVLKQFNAEKQFSQDIIIEDQIAETFTQDVAVAEKDLTATFDTGLVVADLNNEKQHSQDVYVSDRLEKTFTNDVRIASQPAPDVSNPLTVKVLNSTQTYTKVLNPQNTHVKVLEDNE